MDFKQQIKGLRKKHNLTQEQFAERLHVTRQAVSHWENNRNLPDIEMLILISDTFQISLDELIKGETMKEKIIKDGSETRRAKLNMISTILGTALLLLGILLFFIRMNSVEYIDADGFLHESFYLVPMGFLCLLSGLIVFMSIGVRYLIDRWKAFRK